MDYKGAQTEKLYRGGLTAVSTAHLTETQKADLARMNGEVNEVEGGAMSATRTATGAQPRPPPARSPDRQWGRFGPAVRRPPPSCGPRGRRCRGGKPPSEHMPALGRRSPPPPGRVGPKPWRCKRSAERRQRRRQRKPERARAGGGAARGTRRHDRGGDGNE
jgi:hypothetical protein